MKAVVDNSKIILSDYSPAQRRAIKSALTYKDKSKAYELKKMSRWYSMNHPKILAIKSQLSGKLYEEQGDDLICPSGFYDVVKQDAEIVDNRKETGSTTPYPWKNRPFKLRDYQEEAVELICENYRGLINFATGLGKTLVAVYAVKRVRKRALIVCPGELIAKQFYDSLCDALGEHKVGYYGGGKKKIGLVTVGIAASINNDIDVLQKEDFGLVIFDEVHHIAANTFFNIAEGLSHIGKMFGLTATDYRSDGKDILITAGCGSVLLRRDIKWGVEKGWLAQPVFIMKNVHTMGRNYSNDKLKNYKAHVLNNDLMKQTIQSDIQTFLNAGKSVVCLVAEVAHGKELAAALNLPFATGKDKQSQNYIKQLNKGKVPGLIATAGKAGEGVDIVNVDVIVLASFIASKGPVIQAVGRGLRKYKGKKSCVVVDYLPAGSDMLARHALQRLEYYKEITDKVKVI